MAARQHKRVARIRGTDVEKCHDEVVVEDRTRRELAGEDSTEDTWIHASPLWRTAEGKIAGRSQICPSNTRRVILRIDTIDRAYYTVGDGDGQTKAAREATVDVGGDPRPAAQCRTSVLHPAESDS